MKDSCLPRRLMLAIGVLVALIFVAAVAIGLQRESSAQGAIGLDVPVSFPVDI